MAEEQKAPRGGHGGSVEIIGGPGTAEGGNGGRGGSPGHGQGGDGGGGTHIHKGPGHVYSRGGDGGDSGRPARPALGAVSPMVYLKDSSWSSLPGMTDIYGILQPGKGGDGAAVNVTHEGRDYCLNILLQLIRGPVPAVIDNPGIIDAVDELGIKAGITGPQQWWDLAVANFPDETAKVMLHMRTCEAKEPKKPE